MNNIKEEKEYRLDMKRIENVYRFSIGFII